jgi:hypothetical protein
VLADHGGKRAAPSSGLNSGGQQILQIEGGRARKLEYVSSTNA